MAYIGNKKVITVLCPAIEGGGDVELQKKAIVITENGAKVVAPDVEYDGLSEVAITVNVPTGSGEKNEWKGLYKSGTVYEVNDVVEYNGNVYLCIETTNGTQAPTNTEYWSIVNKLLNLGGIDNITPTKEGLTLLPSQYNLDGFDEVIVEPIPDEYVKPSGTLDITENGIRTLQKDDGGYYDSVNVNVPSVEPTLKTQEITENGTYNANDYNADGFSSVTVNVESSGGGAELNIAYGDTAPEDTSKLWVKTSKPSAVIVSPKIETTEGENLRLDTLSATMPASIGYGCAVAVGTDIYIFKATKKNIYKFDTLTQTVTTLGATFAMDGGGASANRIDDKIYLFGNTYNGDDLAVYCFDIVTETLSTLSVTAPTKGGFLSCVLGKRIYATKRNSAESLYCFDTEALTFAEIGSGNAAYWSSFDDGNGGMYLFNTTTTDYFDAKTQTFTSVGVTPDSRPDKMAIQQLGTRLYLFGGVNGGSNSKSIRYIDVKTLEQGVIDIVLPYWTKAVVSAAVGEKIYLFGGGTPVDLSNIIQCFSPDLVSLLENGTLQILPSLTNNTFNLINTDTAQVEIGVNAVYKGNADGIGEQVEAALHNGTSWVTI